MLLQTRRRIAFLAIIGVIMYSAAIVTMMIVERARNERLIASIFHVMSVGALIYDLAQFTTRHENVDANHGRSAMLILTIPTGTMAIYDFGYHGVHASVLTVVLLASCAVLAVFMVMLIVSLMYSTYTCLCECTIDMYTCWTPAASAVCGCVTRASAHIHDVWLTDEN